MVSYSCELCELHKLLAYAHRCNSVKNAKGVINHFLVGFKIHIVEGNMLNTSQSGQEPMVVELIDPRGECTILFFFFLNGHRMKLPSKFISLYQ